MRRIPVLAVFVLVAAPAAVASWSRRDAAPVAAPGVVVVCLDTLRADVLSLDSGRPVRMPRLEAFARESVTFADAIAPAAWTVPSVTSLLTGLDPGNTGVYGFPNTLPEIPRVVPTLPERLVDAGWQTAALTTSAWFGQGAPTLRGFRDGCVGLDLDPEAVLRAWDRRRSHDAPFFLFLHSMAAHDPYLDRDAVRIGARPRPESLVGEDAARMDRIVDAVRRRERPDPADLAWASEASDTSGALRASQLASVPADLRTDVTHALKRWLDDECATDPLLPAVGARLRAAYERGLAEADRSFGRILDGLDGLGLPAGTVVIVVGDHGEAFGEHGTLNHGRRLHDEMVRVPLIVRAPGRLGAPRIVRGPAGLVDVAPTILELAGVAVPSGLDGVSLLDADVGPRPDRALRGFEERCVYEDGADRVQRLTSVRTRSAKAIVRSRRTNGEVLDVEVFDLEQDPLERHPMAPRDAKSTAFTPVFLAALDALLHREAPATAAPRVAKANR